jgi:hypothetical protein
VAQMAPTLIAPLLAGLALGAATGVSCLGGCALLLLPHLTEEGRGWKTAAGSLGAFTAGRVLAYAALAGLFLLLGQQAAQAPWLHRVTAVAMILLAVVVLAYSLGLQFPGFRDHRCVCALSHGARYPAVAGLLAALRPCPPVLLCLAGLAAAGERSAGLAQTLGFLVGTTALLLPLLVAPALRNLTAVRHFAEVAAIFAALWFLSSGLAGLLT